MTYTSIDNPGRGNCAFYAFSISLMEIIQKEYAEEKMDTLNLWCALCPEVMNKRNAILSFNFQNQNKRLLEKLQTSLRALIFSYHIDQLEQARSKVYFRNTSQIARPFIDKIIYSKFYTLVMDIYNRKKMDVYNELSYEPKVKKLAQKVVRDCLRGFDKNDIGMTFESYADSVIFNAFAEDIFGKDYFKEQFKNYNKNSTIIESMARIKKNGHQGTHTDLNILSELFHVQFNCLSNGRKLKGAFFDPEKPTVILNNIRNRHWISKIDKDHVREMRGNELPLNRKEIAAIFKSYTSGFKAFFRTRNHLDMANKIIQACHDKKALTDIMKDLQDYISDETIHFNKNSSFRKRADLILSKNKIYESVDDKLGFPPYPPQKTLDMNF